MKKLSMTQKKFVGAVVIGFLSFFVSWKLMEDKQQEILKTTQMTTVLKARKFIPLGKSIALDWVEESPMPEAYVPAGSLRHKSDLLDAQGQVRFVAGLGIPKSEMLTKTMLAEKGSFGGLAWTLEPGRLATCLRLSLEQSLNGFLQPGDFVNVVSFSQGRSELLLSRIRVLAVGERMWESGGTQFPIDTQRPIISESVFVTLMLASEDVLKLDKATHTGSISLALVSPLDGKNDGG